MFGTIRNQFKLVKTQVRTILDLVGIPPTIKQLFQLPPVPGTSVNVSGHIKAIRKFKKIGFIDLSDGTTYQNLPVIFQDPDAFLAHQNLKVGQSLEISGISSESKGTQSFEIIADDVKIIGDVPDNYPIQKKAMTLPYLRSHPTLRHRTSTLASIMRVRSLLETKLIEFFNDQDFIKVTPPILTAADCEGAGEMFKVEPLNPKIDIIDGKLQVREFFGNPTYLTVSTQLHLEVLASSLNRVWTLSPCFRAENSDTNRHLSEFWMLEAEISYVTQVLQLTRFTEQMIRSVTQALKDNSTDILNSRYSKNDQEVMQTRWDTILSTSDWPSITYTEALELINQVKLKGRLKGRVSWGQSILTEDEKWLAGVHFKGPVFITDYPKEIKPFYMPENKANKTVACFDLILPEIGELVGGSLREHDYQKLVSEMEIRGMNIEDNSWYLSTRENGTIPHGGFGMGFERLIVYLTALENLKDIVTFARVSGSCDC